MSRLFLFELILKLYKFYLDREKLLCSFIGQEPITCHRTTGSLTTDNILYDIFRKNSLNILKYFYKEIMPSIPPMIEIMGFLEGNL